MDFELLPLSALQHLVFCERQCALIHIEGIWAENRFTTEGRILHARSDCPEVEVRGNTRIVRGLQLKSERFGLIGRADVVEFTKDEAGVPVSGVSGRWRVFPVEYKRGRPKPDHADQVQLCAQAICLEEMLNCRIAEAAIFYGEPRRRMDVVLDEALRLETVAAAKQLHRLIAEGKTPMAWYERKCHSCSLIEVCMPKTAAHGKSARSFLETAFEGELGV